MWKPEVIQGGKKERLFRRSENYQKEFKKGFILREQRSFPEDEILEVVREVAAREDFLPEDIEISLEATDPKDQIIEMVVSVRPGKAQGRGWQNIDYHFTLRGTTSRYSPPTRTEVVRHYNWLPGEGSAQAV